LLKKFSLQTGDERDVVNEKLDKQKGRVTNQQSSSFRFSLRQG
jgi:hypothetical protein